MTPVAPEAGLLLAAVLFCLGLLGVLLRRNALFILLCLEIMFNAAAVAFIAAGARWGQADGQILFLLVLVITAAEVAIGLALLLLIFRQRGLNIAALSEMRG